VHEFGHFIVAKMQGVRVEKFALDFGPALLKKKVGETEYSVCAVALGGYVKLAGDNLEEYKGKSDEYLSKSAFARAKIVFFGPFLNYILGLVCFWLVFFGGYPTLTAKVGGLLDGYGAKEAGIIAGDRIIAVDGKKLNSWDDLQMAIYDKEPGAEVKIDYLRAGKNLSANVVLKKKEVDDALGKKRNVGLLGITPDFEETVKVRHGIIESLSLSWQKAGMLTVITYKAIWRMMSGSLSLKDSVTGPIGIFVITAKAAHTGLASILNLIGLLSVSLAIFNLLPLPVLDGGHIFLLLVEKIRGRYLSIKAERIISQAGFLFLMLLVVVVTYNDILRFFGDKISKIIK
ncbi:MAG: RIP metalloprotease RseP, partial [Candidatus Omnitrophica bacterium]|nr:RIP metalloprotease RseP [Candidatus Omnitrophota bacterium]